MSTPDLSNDIRRQIALDPPRFRGVLHSWMVPITVVAGLVAMLMAPDGLSAALIAVHGLCAAAMYTFSALFHRIRWDDNGWWRMRQLDHTGIYLMIAGSCTGIAGLALSGSSRVVLVGAIWIMAALGIGYRWMPVVPPFGLTTALYIILGAVSIPFLGRLGSSLGTGGMVWLIVGCAIYFVGALALGARVPDPWPAVFGYHEVWHVLVVAASVCHYIVLIKYAIPAAQPIAEVVVDG